MLKRTPLAIVVALTLLATASAGASPSASGGATALAYGIRVLVPGQSGGATPTVSAPPDQVQFSGGFSYGDGGAVTTGSANASVSTATSSVDCCTATASAEVTGLSLFGGEITASSIEARATATAHPGSATGSTSGSSVSGLVALGQAVASGGSATLADWGTLRTLEGGSGGSATTGYRGNVTALDIHLTADHGGLPAGTTILVGDAEVSVQAAASAPAPPPGPAPKPVKPGKATVKGAAPEPGPIPTVRRPPNITPPLKTPGGYVFPVYGPSSFTDTFGAARGDVSGGWHHGDDIFAPLGAPVLAIASGTVFSVGWNEIGGNRLWLRDGQGNEFYYAHLSAYTPLAVNGNRVNAGDVLGFVGNTGDAQGTPYHLHFEVHPVGLLYMGYDGAVDPTSYLTAWKHLQDVSFAGGNAWAPFRGASQAPKPGAILISANDISTADGLDPGSLQRAMTTSGTEGSPLLVPAVAPVQTPAAEHASAAAASH